MSVRIRDVEVICTAPEGINLVVVKLLTSEPGLHGLGCATFAYRHLAVALLVREYLKPLLIGRGVEDIEEIWRLLHHNAYWRNGPIENNAISGVDMALWDIKGKMAGMPVYQLLGGKLREGVQVYRHADGKDTAEIFANIDRFLGQGFTHVRCQCGGYGGDGYGPAPAGAPLGALPGVYLEPKRYVRQTIEMFEAIRSKYGQGIEMCHDVHGRLAPRDAINFARDLEPFRLFFLEDAIPHESLDWLPELRAKTSLPLAHGELLNHPMEWRHIVANRLVDFLRVHVSQLGGITPTKKLQAYAEQHGVRIAWHGPGDMSPVGHAANIHLDLASPNFGYQEWSGLEAPNYIIQELKGPAGALRDVFPGMPECSGGYVYPGARPGLGIDVDEREAAKYPCDSGVTLWTQTRMPDGALCSP